ncbi:MAG: Rho termination factor N-terminal domain-containing protein [Pseudomonadota bacterium]
MAVQEYKKRGGGYADDGPDQDKTDLHQWTEEDWGTKSGGESAETGERYLPKKVRMLLTEDEYARSTQRKKNGDQQFVDQPHDVKEKVARIKENGPTKDMLLARAKDLEIAGYSSMTKDDLLDALEAATDENGRAKGSKTALEQNTKEELMEMARDRRIDGRSDMKKEDLVDALADSPDLAAKSRDDLYDLAQKKDIHGRSDMTKEELIDALRKAA